MLPHLRHGSRNWRWRCGPVYDLPVEPGADHGGDQAHRLPQGARQPCRDGEERAAKDPFTGTVFVFRARKADRLKLLYWDGTGLVMAYKRLEEHSFTWPAVKDGLMLMNHAQFEALFAGLDWRRVRAVGAKAPEAVE